jgi:hypothetical protein
MSRKRPRRKSYTAKKLTRQSVIDDAIVTSRVTGLADLGVALVKAARDKNTRAA